MGGHVVFGQQGDEAFFDPAEEEVEVGGEFLQIENEVADELAGAVEGGLSAAVDFDDGMREGGGAEAGAVALASDGVDRVVLEEEELVGGLAGGAGGEGFFLEVEGGLVGEASEPAGGRRGHRGMAVARRLKWVTPMARASAASGGGVSVSPRMARIMNAT